MIVTLHVIPSDALEAATIQAFENLAKKQGKTPEQLLAEVITRQIEDAKKTQAHPYQNANA
jgi:predicted DNA-binding protein